MKRNEIIVYEHKKGVRAVKYNAKPQGHIEPPKPRNPVAKNANASIGGGAAGAHKDAKKASQAVRGQKHKNAEMAEGNDPLQNRADYAKKHGQGQVYKKTYPGDKVGMTKSYAYDVKRTGPKGQLPKEGVEEMYGKRSSYYNPMDYERDQQRQMDYDKREFKRQELQHELGHEDDPDFERKFRQQQIDRDRGPWYLKIDGKIYKQKGMPKSFDWKSGATKYGQAILKNRPELAGKIMLTKKGDDAVSEMGSEVGKITKVDPMTKKATLTKPDGSSMEVDSTALKPTADGKMQMDTPDTDEIKAGTQVVSTEDTTDEEMLSPAPTDSTSPINGDEEHSKVSSLLVKRLRKLAGL